MYLNIPLTVVKNCDWQNILKETKSQFFVCLGTADSISISVSPTKGSRFVIKRNKLKRRKQSLTKLPEGTRVNELERKCCEININIL